MRACRLTFSLYPLTVFIYQLHYVIMFDLFYWVLGRLLLSHYNLDVTDDVLLNYDTQIPGIGLVTKYIFAA